MKEEDKEGRGLIDAHGGFESWFLLRKRGVLWQLIGRIVMKSRADLCGNFKSRSLLL